MSAAATNSPTNRSTFFRSCPSRCMHQGVAPSPKTRENWSPTVALAARLGDYALGAVVSYTAYITYQLSGLRKLQRDVIDRKSPGLLAVAAYPERPLAFLGAGACEDSTLDMSQPYPLMAWSAQFQLACKWRP